MLGDGLCQHEKIKQKMGKCKMQETGYPTQEKGARNIQKDQGKMPERCCVAGLESV